MTNTLYFGDNLKILTGHGGQHNIGTFQRAQRAGTRASQPGLFPTDTGGNGNA